MTIPAIIFGFLVATLYGVIFHLLRGGRAGRLVLYVILSWAGFIVGQFIAGRLGWNFASLGPLHLGIATLGSLVFLSIGYWLSLVDSDKKQKPSA
jgi:O-antigen ligase